MAGTMAGRPMIFHTFQDNDMLEKLGEITTRYLNGKTVGDLFNYLKSYSKGESGFNLFESIIAFVISDEDEKSRSKRQLRYQQEEGQ